MTIVTCKLCGLQFASASSRRMYCPECQKKKNREKSRLRYQWKKINATINKTESFHSLTEKFEIKNKGPSLAEVARDAAKAGMTYGKYVAKYGGKWK